MTTFLPVVLRVLRRFGFASAALLALSSPASAQGAAAADDWRGWVSYNRQNAPPVRFDLMWTLNADGTMLAGDNETGFWTEHGGALELSYTGANGSAIVFTGQMRGAEYSGSAVANRGSNHVEGAFDLYRPDADLSANCQSVAADPALIGDWRLDWRGENALRGAVSIADRGDGALLATISIASDDRAIVVVEHGCVSASADAVTIDAYQVASGPNTWRPDRFVFQRSGGRLNGPAPPYNNAAGSVELIGADAPALEAATPSVLGSWLGFTQWTGAERGADTLWTFNADGAFIDPTLRNGTYTQSGSTIVLNYPPNPQNGTTATLTGRVNGDTIAGSTLNSSGRTGSFFMSRQQSSGGQ